MVACEKDYRKYETDSGIKLFSVKDESLPFIKYDVYFPQAGADYSFEGKSGLAALTAYLLDQGAGGLSSEEIQEELNQLGTELGISLGRQTLRMSLSGLSWHKDKLFDLFKKIVISPHFKEQELEILRKQFLTRRKRSLDRPPFVADDFMRQTLFGGGSLAQASHGDLLSLSQINLEDIKSFYETHYKQGNPIFSITGHFDSSLEKEFSDFIDQNFRATPLKKSSLAMGHQEAQFQLLTKPGLIQAEVRLFYHLFPFPKEDFKSFLALHLANSILGGGGMTSRLHTEVREKRGLTYGVYSYPGLGKKYGLFEISGATQTASVKEFIEQVLFNLEKIKKEGVSLEELNEAKNQARVNYLKNIETPENKLFRLLYYTEYLDLNPKTFDRYLEVLDSVSLEDVNRIFDKFVLSSPSDRLKELAKPHSENQKARLQILVYGDPSLQSELEKIKTLSPLKVIRFEDHFKEDLDSQKL